MNQVFVHNFEFNITKCRFVEGLLVECGVYDAVLRFAFMEIFFNQFKYMYYDKPEISIGIEGKLFNSDDYVTDYGTHRDQPTVLTFQNPRGRQPGGAQIGKSFLLNIAKIAEPEYTISDMVVEDGKKNLYSVAFPVLVRRV